MRDTDENSRLQWYIRQQDKGKNEKTLDIGASSPMYRRIDNALSLYRTSFVYSWHEIKKYHVIYVFWFFW